MVAGISYWIVDFLDGRHDDRDVEVSLILEEAFCLGSRPRLAKDG